MMSKLGFLSSIKFKQTTLPKLNYVYQNYEGSYENINHKFQEILSETNQVFKFSDLFGIYYEANASAGESGEEQLNKSKAAVGLIIKEIEVEKIDLMMKKFPNKYKIIETPPTICVGTQYPYFNAASLVMIINRVYPKLAQFIAEKRLEAGPGVMEIYCVNDSNPHVKILVPI